MCFTSYEAVQRLSFQIWPTKTPDVVCHLFCCCLGSMPTIYSRRLPRGRFRLKSGFWAFLGSWCLDGFHMWCLDRHSAPASSEFHLDNASSKLCFWPLSQFWLVCISLQTILWTFWWTFYSNRVLLFTLWPKYRNFQQIWAFFLIVATWVWSKNPPATPICVGSRDSKADIAFQRCSDPDPHPIWLAPSFRHSGSAAGSTGSSQGNGGYWVRGGTSWYSGNPIGCLRPMDWRHLSFQTSGRLALGTGRNWCRYLLVPPESKKANFLSFE